MTGWRDLAACADLPPGVMFPPEIPKGTPAGERKALLKERRRVELAAKEVCADCPVMEECLADAMEEREWDGVRGGKTERERRMMAGQRRGSTTASGRPSRSGRRRGA